MRFKTTEKIQLFKEEKGAVAAIAAIVLIVLLGVVSLVVDFGYGVATKTEIQSVADSAALAAAGHLDGTPAGMTRAHNAALNFAALNTAAGGPGTLSIGNVEFGTWTMPNVFTPSADPAFVDAVRVTTRRNAASGTELPTVFGGAIDKDIIEVGADAVAQVVGSACSGPDCGIELPIVICDDMLQGTPPYCAVQVMVNPTPTQDAGITSFFTHNANANNISEFILNPSTIPDVTTVFDPPPSSCYLENNRMQEPNVVEMNEGTLPPIFSDMQDEWMDHTQPCRDSGSGPDCSDVDGDGNWEWKTVIAVAWCNGGPVPNGACIRGFANFYVEEVCTSQSGYECWNNGGATGTKAIYGFAECDGNGEGGSIADTVGVSPVAGLVR